MPVLVLLGSWGWGFFAIFFLLLATPSPAAIRRGKSSNPRIELGSNSFDEFKFSTARLGTIRRLSFTRNGEWREIGDRAPARRYRR